MIDFDFELERPEFCLKVAAVLPGKGVSAVFGRSGSGKTTLLRCLAGLEPSVKGRLSVGGAVWQGPAVFLPPQGRSIGYVFQEGRLFPHLSVLGNLLYGYRRVPARQRRLQVDHVVELLGLAELLQRAPAELSGGQRQRVAVGRALLTSPSLLLMDEPLAALDATSKAEILPWLEGLHQALDIPVIYVSHAIEEVARLADVMLLLEDGRLRAQGALADILTRSDLPLAHADNACSIINAEVVAHDAEYHLLELAFAGGRLRLPYDKLPSGRQVRVRLAARDVVIGLAAPADSSALNCLAARVVQVSADAHPAHVLVRLAVADTVLLARVTRHSAHHLALGPGLQVYAQIKAVAIT